MVSADGVSVSPLFTPHARTDSLIYMLLLFPSAQAEMYAQVHREDLTFSARGDEEACERRVGAYSFPLTPPCRS